MSRSLLCVLLLALPAAAQPVADGGTDDTQARLRALEERVSALSQALEAQTKEPAPASASGPSAGGAASGMAPAAGKVYGGPGGLSIGGYGETVLSFFASHLQNGTFVPQDAVTDTLRAVVYVGYKFTDHIVFDSELEFEHGGFSDLHAEGEAIVEFAYLDFLLHPALNVRVGQVLLPVGFLNELHEPPIFFGALRPYLEQETGLIPTTWHENGLGLHGELPAGLSYKLYVVNGLNAARFNADGTASIGGGRQDGHQAIANKPAFTGRLDWHPVPGGLLGASFYTGNSAQSHGAVPLQTTMVEAHAEYRTHGLALRALAGRVTNSPTGLLGLGPSSAQAQTGSLQTGGYVEAGYDVLSLVPGTTFALLPFVRYERFNLQTSVAPGVTAAGDTNLSFVEVGANFKPIPQVVLKGDYDIETNAAHTGRNQLNLAVGYLF